MFNPSNLSVEYLERMLAEYRSNPSGLPPQWRQYFEEMENGDSGSPQPVFHAPSFRPRSVFNPVPPTVPKTSAPAEDLTALRSMLGRLADAYRARGHLAARIDPLDRPPPGHSELTPAFYGISESDLDRPVFATGNDRRRGTLRDRIERLRRTYCGSIGSEFTHIDDLAIRQWLLQRIEATENRLVVGPETRTRILGQLAKAVVFEEFVLKKYLGAKTFSLEGAEVLIPLLDMAIEKAAGQGVRQIVMGMAHRGRLNVLTNILGKSAGQIFAEFEDNNPTLTEGGDVKYHLGHSNDRITSDGTKVHLTLCFNPSHLEFVDPVAEGSMRAKQDRSGDLRRERGMAILIHGDAAFAGEGVVQETLNLSQLPSYTTGGTLHVVINNQLGFTTGPREGRSTRYATDVAKMLQVPIFHVNGEQPEAVAQVLDLALDFRHRFHHDVLIDLMVYRRRGHNESDEPEFTQPVLYKEIAGRKTVHTRYMEELAQQDVVAPADAEQTVETIRSHLEEEYRKAQRGEVSGPSFELGNIWRGYSTGLEAGEEVDFGVSRRALGEVLRRLTEVPEDFRVHPKLKRWLRRRRAMADGQRPLDWSAAEALALATLSLDGYRVRLSGQDTARGTFSQRHAVLHDVEDGRTYMPLAHLGADQAPVEIINSPLCEAAALGFEFGYSMDYPDGLVAWEAQFGDFWNAGQVIVDQFLASAEEKWRRLSGMTLLLPHGFEGQGPEHSSARIERFLRLATKDNLQIVVPSTPAQYFHCLRRQMNRRWLKPLIIITPKSLLRHPRVESSLEECASGRFQRLIPDAEVPGGRPDRVLMCSGKIYYDLLEKREQSKQSDVAILRLEQIYPFPKQQIQEALAAYDDGTPLVWVQEEPENMGACHFLRDRFRDGPLGRYRLRVVARPPAASPATGSASIHRKEQARILAAAFGQQER